MNNNETVDLIKRTRPTTIFHCKTRNGQTSVQANVLNWKFDTEYKTYFSYSNSEDFNEFILKRQVSIEFDYRLLSYS